MKSTEIFNSKQFDTPYGSILQTNTFGQVQITIKRCEAI